MYYLSTDNNIILINIYMILKWKCLNLDEVNSSLLKVKTYLKYA